MTLLSDEAAQRFVTAIRQAAKNHILPRFRNLQAHEISTKSSPNDLVTIVDQKVETDLSQAAAQILPQAAIIGEEAVAADPGLLHEIQERDWAVIIDPLDGTSNFVCGLSSFGVILAVVYQGRTVFGVIYDPIHDDWISAHRGAGAWLCGENAVPDQLRVAEPKPFCECEGFVSTHLFPQEHRPAIAAAFAAARLSTSLRTSALEYRQLALGRAQFNVSALAKPWDHAAGALIVQEAGGVVETSPGQTYQPSNRSGPVVAGNCPSLIASVWGFI